MGLVTSQERLQPNIIISEAVLFYSHYKNIKPWYLSLELEENLSVFGALIFCIHGSRMVQTRCQLIYQYLQKWLKSQNTLSELFDKPLLSQLLHLWKKIWVFFLSILNKLSELLLFREDWPQFYLICLVLK